MKKLILLIVLCAFSVSVPAQAAHKKHRHHKGNKQYREHVHHTVPFGTYPAV
ncbi:MAG TPA: hypothetical protein VE998_07330 [Terriglobales bacterium]|nr:hypothetical protein [Terriglobales bacterium]